MDSPHELVMEANQAFVNDKGIVVEPVLGVTEQLWDPL
jgi:hypothetical protein